MNSFSSPFDVLHTFKDPVETVAKSSPLALLKPQSRAEALLSIYMPKLCQDFPESQGILEGIQE